MSIVYPKRPPYFACKFVRLLTKKAVANEIGPQVCWLLAVVAMQEDARGYTDAVTFYNGQLAPLVGVGSVDALDRVRQRAIKAGWLVYVPGGRWSGAGRYMVTIPDRFAGTDDFPTDEPPPGGPSLRESAEQDAASLRTGAEQDGVSLRVSAEQDPGEWSSLRGSAEQGAEQDPIKVRNLLFVPVPEEEGADEASASTPPKAKKRKPKPEADPAAVPVPVELDTPAFRAAWADWMADRKARSKPLTTLAARQQLASLTPLGPDRAAECIRLSITNTWTGLFSERFAARATPSAASGPDPPR